MVGAPPERAWQNAGVPITKCASTDAFVAIDLPDAPVAVGVVRCAKKILQDGATNLARTRTYTYAAFGEKVSGASAGINAEGDARDEAVGAFVTELADQVAAGSLRLAAAKGVSAEDLAPWASTAAPSPEAAERALVASTLAALGAVRDLAGATVAVEVGAPSAEAIAAAANAAGATATLVSTDELLAGDADTSWDAVVIGAKQGGVTHENVARLGTATVISAAPLSITARGLANARKQGATVLADFVTAAGPVLAELGHDDATIADKVATVVAATKDHQEGAFLGACYHAEDFLRTWTAELPFGRPMA